MIDVLFVDEQVTLAATALMPSIMAVVHLATLHRTDPTRFLLQEHHASKTDLLQGISIHAPKGTDHTPPMMVPDIGDISAGQAHTIIPSMTEVAVLEDIPHALLPATASTHTTLWPIDGPIAPHAVTATGIVTPHPTLATSPTDISDATPQTTDSLI